MKQRVFFLVMTALALAAVDARADVGATVADIERLPRGKRLTAYERAISEKGISAADRVELIRAFAKHVRDLSPLYGKERFPFDEQNWLALLRDAFAASPRDADIAWALAQLHVDRRDHRAALPVVKTFREAHPAHHHALAWLAWCEAQQTPAAAKKPGELLTFPVHFCVLTRNPQALKAATREQCRKECDILNATFRTLDGKPMVQFAFKGFAAYQEIKNAQDELLRFGDGAEECNTDLFAKAFNACKDRRVRDPQAINFYIYDSYSAKGGFADTTSHGKRNSNRPFVLIDWQRLNNALQNAEAHEMGHAFGLEHVGVPGAREKSSTNIMASASEQFGSGGQRDLGFSPSQAAVIVYHAKRTHDRLRTAK